MNSYFKLLDQCMHNSIWCQSMCINAYNRIERLDQINFEHSLTGILSYCRLSIFRWIIPSNGEVVIRLRFQSEELGQFDQTLNFEIVGTRRRYQLYCRGVCAFPSISREPRYRVHTASCNYQSILSCCVNQLNMEFCYFSGLCFLTVKRTKSLMKLCTRNTSWLLRHSNLAHCPQENQEQSEIFNGFFSPRIPKY